MKGFEKNSSAGGLAQPLLIGTVIGIAAILGLLIIAALLISFKILPVTAAPTISAVASAAGGFAGGFFAARRHKRIGLVTGLLCGAALFSLFTIIGLAAFTAAPAASTLIRFLIFITSGAVGGILGVGDPTKRKIV